MTLSRINEQFMLHRQVCSVCASPGAGLCRTGMEILREYYAVLQAVTHNARKAG